MKENRSNKPYNSKLKRCVEQLLYIDFNIEPIPGTKMRLLDIARQSNQQANVITKSEELAVVTISRIPDAITAIYTQSPSTKSQYSTITR